MRLPPISGIPRVLPNFNPRIHEGCDLGLLQPGQQLSISIHASMKDATKISEIIELDKEISIHASMKDATVSDSERVMNRDISIHASMKDATTKELEFSPRDPFQSTHP